MHRVLILMAAMAAISSCKTSEQRRAEEQASDRQFCTSIGATGEKFADCMMQKDRQRARNAELDELSNQQNLRRMNDYYNRNRGQNRILTNVSCPPSYGTGVSRTCLVY